MCVEVEKERVHVSNAQSSTHTGETGALMAVLNDARLLVISLWLGAAVFFSAVVAPVVFSTLRTLGVEHANHAAGSIVTRSLEILNMGGFVASLLLITTAFIFRGRVRKSALYAELIALAVIALMTALGQWVIDARMLAIRVAMGKPIDEVAQSDPLRIEFNSLHGYSVAVFGVAIVAGAAALLLIARRRARA